MSKIKAIITDLDDTLLMPDKQILQAFHEVLEKLKDRDIPFSLITGRPKYATDRYVEQLDISHPVICCNGAIIYNTEEVIIKHSFNISLLKDLMLKADAMGITVLFYTNDVEYAMSETAWVKVRTDAGRSFPVWDLSDDDWEHIQCEKINLMSNGKEVEFESLLDDIEAVRRVASVYLYGLNGCEIVAKHVDKSLGMREFAKLLGIEEHEIMAIGDNTNDHTMLQNAGLGIAVNNATEDTKTYADHVMSQSYTEGVIEAINRYVLMEKDKT